MIFLLFQILTLSCNLVKHNSTFGGLAKFGCKACMAIREHNSGLFIHHRLFRNQATDCPFAYGIDYRYGAKMDVDDLSKKFPANIELLS